MAGDHGREVDGAADGVRTRRIRRGRAGHFVPLGIRKRSLETSLLRQGSPRHRFPPRFEFTFVFPADGGRRFGHRSDRVRHLAVVNRIAAAAVAGDGTALGEKIELHHLRATVRLARAKPNSAKNSGNVRRVIFVEPCLRKRKPAWAAKRDEPAFWRGPSPRRPAPRSASRSSSWS